MARTTKLTFFQMFRILSQGGSSLPPWGFARNKGVPVRIFMKRQKASEHTERHEQKKGLPGECPDGFLTPRELVGYLRAREETGEELPPEVDDHLRTCDVCSDNWAFIMATDPALQRVREQRVALLIKNVGAMVAPGDAAVSVSSQERDGLVSEVEKGLLESGQRPQEETLFKAEIQRAAELPYSRILEMCAEIQKIEDEESRYRQSIGLSGELSVRIDRMRENGTIDLTALEVLFEKSTESINLGRLQNVTLDAATAFVASFPQTSYYPGLLERSGDDILFHQKRFYQLRPEFNKIAERPVSGASTVGGPQMRVQGTH
jgi:hypothetical protein